MKIKQLEILQKEMLSLMNESGCVANDEARNNFFKTFENYKGGVTKLRIILTLLHQSKNAQQISENLNMDYNGILSHLRKLEKMNHITKTQNAKNNCDAKYHVTDFFKCNKNVLVETIKQLDKKIYKKTKKTVYY